MNYLYKVFFIALFFLATASAFSQIRLPKVIGNNMVLQQNAPLPVWGWAAPGEKVTVKFAGEEKSAQADNTGYWKVVLSPLPASEDGRELTITGSNTITLSNILIGEVWLCSGQSNMEYPMKLNAGYAKPAKSADSAALELSANYPAIRLFKVEKVLSTPDVTTTGWNLCKGEALEKFSAAGYFFARNLYKELHVPIGIIQSAWGGSRIEPWTPESSYAALPVFKQDSAGSPLKIDGVVPGRNYNCMIKPLAPFALKGFLWYQGESNCMINDGIRYADKMQALIDGWRKEWGNENLSFYSVLIAPYLYTRRKDPLPHTEETLAEFWEAQNESLKIPKTAMIVTTDLVDNLSDIHPSYKWVVGRRLSLLALAHDYNRKNLEYSGPVFSHMKRKKQRIILYFDHATELRSTDGKALKWFTVAGKDGKYVPAVAAISGNKIVVSGSGVRRPVNVRFAWSETAQPSLFNKEGLPAVPFRTDGKKWKYRKY